MSENQQDEELGRPMFAIRVKTEGVLTCEGTSCDSDCPIHGNANKE